MAISTVASYLPSGTDYTASYSVEAKKGYCNYMHILLQCLSCASPNLSNPPFGRFRRCFASSRLIQVDGRPCEARLEPIHVVGQNPYESGVFISLCHPRHVTARLVYSSSLPWKDAHVKLGLKTHTVIAPESNGQLSWTHDRMPVILKASPAARWLDGAGCSYNSIAIRLLQFYSGRLDVCEVSTLVSNIKVQLSREIRVLIKVRLLLSRQMGGDAHTRLASIVFEQFPASHTGALYDVGGLGDQGGALHSAESIQHTLFTCKQRFH